MTENRMPNFMRAMIPHNIPAEVLQLKISALLDHLQAPGWVGASLRKWVKTHGEYDHENLGSILEMENPVLRLRRYRGMGVTSLKWLMRHLEESFQLPDRFDWSYFEPDNRSLEDLTVTLEKIDEEISNLESKRRSVVALISVRKRSNKNQ